MPGNKTGSNDKSRRDEESTNGTRKAKSPNGGDESRKSKTTAAQMAEDAKNRTIGHYVVGRSLGSGTFGKVRIGTHTITGEKVAIKILEKDRIKDKGDVERVTREINILKKVRHPNVIQLYEIIETSRQLFLIMEYASGGELFDHIVKRKKLKEAEACKFFQQVISGVEYIHRCGICHRDLKPENLLLDESKNIKIVDFGLSNTYTEGGLLKTACGSPCYAAPEMIAGKKYHGLASDIWSCGIILYAMTCGYLPFEDPNTNKLYKKILACDYTIPSSLSSILKDLMKKILNTDPAKRITIGDIRSHDWYSKIRSVEMEGVIIGKDKIPVISEFIDVLREHFQGDNLEQATTFVQNNKHNQVTSTYYLLLKKKERVTGKNYVFEQVTFDKRKNLYSTSNLKGNNSRGLEGLNSTQRLFGQTYARSEGRPGLPVGADYTDVRSHVVSSANTTHQNNREESIHKRVADIINLPSKAIAPANANQMNPTMTHKLAMQTFNTDSIRPHFAQKSGLGGTTNQGNSNTNARVAQSHSPTQIQRKQAGHDAQRPSVSIKAHLAQMNQTFHSGQKGHIRANMPAHNKGGAFQRPASLDNQPIPSRQQQYTADIHNGTMNLDETIASGTYNQSSGQKPDTSHTAGNAHQAPSGTGVLTQVPRQSGQAIMAQTFTGKMFNMRNNSLKAQGGGQGHSSQGHHGVNNLVHDKSNSVPHNNSGKANNNINIQNFTQLANSGNQARHGGAQGQNSQNPNMNLLLTQFFPNNNYTARHQSLIGQQNKMKKKVKSHDLSQSPPRGAHQGSGKAGAASHQQQMDGTNLNLTNMKMRMINNAHQQNQNNSNQYLQQLSVSIDQNQENHTPQHHGGRHTNKGSGQNAQTRRLMETSNMFTMYRNSLKNNLNNNSNGFADSNGFPQGGQHFSEPHSKTGTAAVGGQHMFATARQGGFYQDPGAMQLQLRGNQRKISEMNGNLLRSSDVESIGPPNVASPMHDAQQQRFGMNQQMAVGGQGQHPTLKVQDLLRNVNNKSGTSHHQTSVDHQNPAAGGSPADYIAAHFNTQNQHMVSRDQQPNKQGVASHLVHRTGGVHALAPNHAAHANSQSIRQKDHGQTTALQNNFTAMTSQQQNAMLQQTSYTSNARNASQHHNHAATLHHPSMQPGGSGRSHDHRNTFYGGKQHGSGNGAASLSVPRTSIGSHVTGPGHHRDTSVHVTKRSGFSYF